MNHAFCDHELQRLVDGRLSGDEREALLKCADDQPHLWRILASAFIEEQILCESLCPPVDPNQRGDPNQRAAEPRRAVPAPRRGRAIFTQAIAVSLCLVVGVVIGRSTLGPAITTQDDSASVAAKSGSSSSSYIAPVSLPGSLSENNGVPESNDATTENEDWDLLSTPLFDENARNMVRQHGYNVLEESVIYLLEDSQGDRYVIPRRHVSLIAADP